MLQIMSRRTNFTAQSRFKRRLGFIKAEESGTSIARLINAQSPHVSMRINDILIRATYTWLYVYGYAAN